MIETQYSLGQQVWNVRTSETTQKETCPDCNGERFLILTLGNGDTHSIKCDECGPGYQESTGYLIRHIPTVYPVPMIVVGVEVNKKNEVQYRVQEEFGHEGSYYLQQEDSLFGTEEACRAKIAELDAAEKEREANHYKNKVNRNKSWNANAAYHRRAIKKATEDIAYHTKCLNYAAGKVKFEKKESTDALVTETEG